MLQIFDKLSIKDNRIPALCAQSIEFTPFELLNVCLQRYDSVFNMIY